MGLRQSIKQLVRNKGSLNFDQQDSGSVSSENSRAGSNGLFSFKVPPLWPSSYTSASRAGDPWFATRFPC